MQSHLILIPARSGSTRVKNKNIRNLYGKPLLAYAVESAVAVSDRVRARVIVSTNNEEIASIARRYGAETPFLRPKELSHAESTSISAVLHALDWLSANESWHPEIVAFRPPTCPFLSEASLTRMFSELEANPSVPSLNTIYIPEVHPYAMVRRRENGTIEFGAIEIDGRTMLEVERSQDYPKVWAQTAACRMYRSQFFLDILQTESTPYDTRRKFCGELECLGHEISLFEAFDIDTEEDLQLAEALLRKRE